MTWTDIALAFLVAERSFAIAYGVYVGARDALNASQIPCDCGCTGVPVPKYVDIDAPADAAYDYSSGRKQH
jgi:hypothetical protein